MAGFGDWLVNSTRLLFVGTSEYDSWQIANVCRDCHDNASGIAAFAAALVTTLNASLLASSPAHGAFVDSCYHHCAYTQWTGMRVPPTVDGGVSLADAFAPCANAGTLATTTMRSHTAPGRTDSVLMPTTCAQPSSPGCTTTEVRPSAEKSR